MKLDVQRVFDLAVTAVVLPLALPLVLLAFAIVWMSMGSPVLFRHVRTGLHGRLFTLYKLRTMRAGAPGEPDDSRLTAMGRVLRSLSVDELPQLWNVLRGDMSLVGPRPLLPEYLDRYTPEQARRHEVRPGITGLAQVSGRNALTWEQKFALDVWYADHRNVALDARLLLRTVGAIVGRSGVSAPGVATMPEFMGDLGRRDPAHERGSAIL